MNCVDRHYKKNPKKVALIWDQDEPGQEVYVTYEYGRIDQAPEP